MFYKIDTWTTPDSISLGGDYFSELAFAERSAELDGVPVKLPILG
jgi:hypothetical protein